MSELSSLEPRYNAFLHASLGAEDDMAISVLSVLARQDVDPWQEADRLAQLPKEQAINSLASRIWRSNSQRWSPSEATIFAGQLIELLPSHGDSISVSRPAKAGNGGMMLWFVLGALIASTVISGNSIKNLTKSSNNSTNRVSAPAQQEASPQSPRGFITD